jgi:hypothetical protein
MPPDTVPTLRTMGRRYTSLQTRQMGQPEGNCTLLKMDFSLLHNGFSFVTIGSV